MTVVCANCGSENAAGRRFCDQCGSPLASGCPTCGAENRPGARFCGNCGSPLPGAPSAATETRPSPAPERAQWSAPDVAEAQSPMVAAERRLVSILFADLVGFTPLAESRDPEHVRDLLSRYFDTARAAIERHGGRVEKFIGDAVMAAWGAPRANEDDPERAVRAALEVVDAVQGLGEGLQARAGVLTGQAAVTVGSPDQAMVAGDLVNTAARLQAVAPAGTVLVGEATMQAAASAIAFEPVGEQLLKGKSSPIPAWRALRVISDRGGRGRAEGLEPPFVGREVELRLLKDLIHAAGAERRPRLISITGPAGIGKSRLAWEFEKYVDGLVEAIYWHRGRAPSYGEGVTFWALGEMVRRRARLLETDDEATTRARIAEAVAEHVPDEADRAWVAPALLALLGVEAAPSGGRDALFAAWRIFFERIAAKGTTVMLFEDLQWADSGQLDFVDHVMEWSRGVPLLVITLSRPELLERRPGFGTSARSFNAIGLEPLTQDQMRQLLLGVVPEMPGAAVERILARADGIPLYAVETVRMLAADGRLAANEDGTFRPTGDLGKLAVPDSLRALVASRLDALDADVRALLQDAAVLGKTFATPALAAISGHEEQGLEDRLRSLAKRELLEVSVDPRSPERGQFGFVQSVIREVAYDTLSRRDRRTRHLAAARYFEAQGDDELAGVLATHYLAAHDASEPGPEAEALQAQARLALRGAADRALTLGSADQAMAYLGEALAISARAVDRADLLERLAKAADHEGRYDEAEAAARQAIAAHEEAEDRSGGARVSALMGGILVDASKLTEAIDFLEAALARADQPDDEPVRADMLSRLSRAHMRLVQEERAIARADEALAIAEPRRLDRIVAEAFINKGAALGGLGRLREPRVLLEAAIGLAASVGDTALELRARNNLAAVLAYEDGRAAQRTLREAFELATRVGIRQMAHWLAGTVAFGSISEGLDWDAPLAIIGDALEASPSDVDRLRLIAIRELILTWRGEDTSADARARDSLMGAGSDPDLQAWNVILPTLGTLLGGRVAAAVEGFRRAIPVAAQSVTDARLGFIRSAHWARDLEAAREGLREAEAEPWSGVYIEAERALAAAGIAALEGRTGDAVRDFRRSVSDLHRMGALFEAALAQLDALILLPGEPELAGWAEEARARFEILRARPLLDRLGMALSSAPAEARRPG